VRDRELMVDAFNGEPGRSPFCCAYEAEARAILGYGRIDIALGFDRWIEAHNARDALTARYAWAIPNEQALRILVRRAPIVEIGAGLGYWAMLLSERGADVVAYDKTPAGSKRPNRWFEAGRKSWSPVKYGGATAAKRHGDRTLFLCWPYMNSMAARALAVYTGSTVVYIGECRGGCCANDAFFKALNKGWDAVDGCKLLQWPGIHDELVVWEPKERREVTA